MKPLRDLLKHSSVYMVGQILARMASLLLLPFYTDQLSRAEYGVVGILDLTASILTVLIAGGLVSAVTRYHFDDDDEGRQDRVWWTGLTMVFSVATVLTLGVVTGRNLLAEMTLPEVDNGAWFYVLAISTMWFNVHGMILDAYLRVQKRSGLFVLISTVRLVLNIGLNIWLIAGLKMGVEGLLIGNLTAAIVNTSALSAVFLKTRGGYSLDRIMGREMIRFASPLVVTALATMMIHQMDHYFLLWWSPGNMDENMGTVGVYALAHKIAFAVNTLVLLPFLSIWHVAIYDIERMDNSESIFAKIFGYFTSGVGVLLLGASLTVHPLLPMLTPEDYGPAMDLIAGVLLGFYVFGLSLMFEVPSLLSKRTKLMIPGAIIGVVVNFVACWFLVPQYGAWGATWAGVLTYIGYGIGILYCCRNVVKYQYPWAKFAITTSLCCGAYVGIRFGLFPHIGPWAQVGVSVLVCAVFAIAFSGKEGLGLAADFLKEKMGRQQDEPSSKEETDAANQADSGSKLPPEKHDETLVGAS